MEPFLGILARVGSPRDLHGATLRPHSLPCARQLLRGRPGPHDVPSVRVKPLKLTINWYRAKHGRFRIDGHGRHLDLLHGMLRKVFPHFKAEEPSQNTAMGQQPKVVKKPLPLAQADGLRIGARVSIPDRTCGRIVKWLQGQQQWGVLLDNGWKLAMRPDQLIVLQDLGQELVEMPNSSSGAMPDASPAQHQPATNTHASSGSSPTQEKRTRVQVESSSMSQPHEQQPCKRGEGASQEKRCGAHGHPIARLSQADREELRGKCHSLLAQARSMGLDGAQPQAHAGPPLR